MLTGGVLILIGILSVSNASAAASEIREEKSQQVRFYMNQTQDPCKNFYEFACGNWATLHPASKEQKKNTFSTKGAKLYERKMAEFLSGIDETNTDELRMAKSFYLLCLKRSQDPKDYRENLIQIVNEFGKMPVLERENGSWKAASFDWLKVVGEIAFKYNKNILLGFSIRPDLSNPSDNSLILRHFDSPLGASAFYLNASNEMYRREYRDEIAQDLRDFLAIEPALAEKTASEILNFEIELVRGADKDTIPGGEMAAITSFVELQKRYSQRLDVKRLFELSFGNISLPNWRVSERTAAFQENLICLLSRTAPETLANYVFYNLLRHFIVPLRKPKISPQDSCMQSVRESFYFLVENAMYHKLNVASFEEDVQQLFGDIKTQFQKAFESDKYSPWISEKTRQQAVEKLKAITLQLDTFDNVDFKQRYNAIPLNSQDFLENLRSIFIKDAEYSRLQMTLPPIPNFSTRIEEGPRHSLYLNRVYMPIVKLVPHHYWSKLLPKVVNYAQLGVLLAHEIVHSFDHRGQHFSASNTSGNWWDSNAQLEYETRSQCLAAQYKTYSYGGKLLQSDKDQTENVADNGAVSLAYESYMDWAHRIEEKDQPHVLKDEMLPHLNYTLPQLFFILYAQQYCSDVHPFYVDEIVSTGPHAPASLRVMGALRNSQAFANEFNCPKGSAMNPVVKCVIF